MTPEQFCYWLQGAFETMDEGRGLSKFDHTVRDHLKTVLEKRTPDGTSPRVLGSYRFSSTKNTNPFVLRGTNTIPSVT